MARKNRSPEENARREKIRELLQMANIGSMEDIQSLFKETIAEFIENGLEAELDDELGYSKYLSVRSSNGLMRAGASTFLLAFTKTAKKLKTWAEAVIRTASAHLSRA